MGKKILSVDDSASVRQMVAFTLRSAGYEVIEACDGRDALGQIKSASVDMVITDLNMPVMDGVELIKALRSEPAFKFTPIVMLTTESGVDKKTAGREAGATGWMVKPFKPEELLSVVKRLIG
ncbi:MAG TPA: response regulator [Deltaproteobacteria bacterium]|nr:response regulator [Deltaproteobacteria bacterium]